MSTKIKIFLSHNSADKPAVESLALRLGQEADIDPWLDKWNLIPGQPWQEELEEAIKGCTGCVIFIGRGDPQSGVIGPWQNAEMRALISRQVSERGSKFAVIPVLLPGAERGQRSSLPTFLVANTWVEFRHNLDDPDAFQRLLAGIRGKPIGPPTDNRAALATCPYRGLKYFDIGDAHLFFGREAVTEWLVDDVRKPLRAGSEAPRFVAILGASGSGKSSLARAGLYAALKQGAIEGSDNWLFVPPLRPGANPLESLEIEFLKAAAGSPHLASVATHLKELATNPAALHRAARQLVPDSSPPRRVFLFVDQFEEIFTECDKAGLRGPFLAALLYAARERGGPVIVVLAMRADFYPQVAAFEELARVMDQHQFLVGPMSEAELRQAIEVPAYRAGADFDPGLVDKLIADVLGQPGALPLLQHALAALWRERVNGRQLTHDAYRTMGGLSGALEKHANKIFDDLTPEQQKLCEHLFLRQVHPGEGAEDTKRRVPLAELTSSGNPVVVAKLIATLSHEDNRLIVTEGGDGQKSDAPAASDAKHNLHSASPAFVEVAHEALIRSWSRLRKWIDADRSGLRTHRRLTEAAKEWEDKRRHPEFLYSSGRLAIAREWAAKHRDQLAKIEDEFLVASQKEEDRVARASKSIKVFLTAVVIALLAGGFGVISSWVWIQYHTYTAELGGTDRPDELVITRQLKHVAPLKISTGFTRDLLLAGGVTNFDFNVPHAISDWGTIENHLHPLAKIRLLFATRLDAIAAAVASGKDEELARVVTTVSQDAVADPDISLFAAADTKAFDYVFTLLRIGDPAAKRAAASALGRLGEKLAGERAGAVTDALLAALKDNEAEVNIAAAEALGQLGEKLPGERLGAVTDALLATLKANEAAVKRAAASALVRLGEKLAGERAGAVTDALLGALKDNEAAVKDAAAYVLGGLGEKLAGKRVGAVTDALLGALKDNEAFVRSAAASALVRLGEKLADERVGAVTDALRGALKDNEAFVRSAAASALVRLGEKLAGERVGAVTDALLGALKDNEADVKRAAASALVRLGEKLAGERVEALRDALLAALKDNQAAVKSAAAYALGGLGEKLAGERVGAFTDALLGALKDNDADVKRAAASALGGLGEKLAGELVGAVTDALLGALKGNEADVKSAAAYALGGLGEKLAGKRVGAVTEALVAALKDNDWKVKSAAASALVRLGAKLPGERVGAVTDALVAALKDNDSAVKRTAAEAMSRLGEKLPGERVGALTDALLAALKDNDSAVKRAAAAALGGLGEKLPGERVGAVTDALLVAIKDNHSAVKSAAASALVRLGEKLPGERVGAVTDALLVAINDNASDVNSAAASALGGLGEKLAGEQVGAFTDALLVAIKDNNAAVKRAAASALGAFAKRMESAKRRECVQALVHAARQQMKEGRLSILKEAVPVACLASLRKLTVVDSVPDTRLLLQHLEHLDSRARLFAIFTLPRRKLEPADLGQIRRLRDDLQHRPWVRVAALETLVEIAREAEAVARDKEEAAKAAEKEKQEKAGALPAFPR